LRVLRGEKMIGGRRPDFKGRLTAVVKGSSQQGGELFLVKKNAAMLGWSKWVLWVILVRQIIGTSLDRQCVGSDARVRLFASRRKSTKKWLGVSHTRHAGSRATNGGMARWV
jgi:hypothetical protein